RQADRRLAERLLHAHANSRASRLVIDEHQRPRQRPDFLRKRVLDRSFREVGACKVADQGHRRCSWRAAAWSPQRRIPEGGGGGRRAGWRLGVRWGVTAAGAARGWGGAAGGREGRPMALN